MASKMLIDAAHSEETRVAVVDGSRVEEFDYETVTKAQISGNIYLARVTRVEPSLQAAFVEYGGGRHGFLAFSEIHPDYYQIPAADREALLAAQRAAEEEEEEETERRKPGRRAKAGAEKSDKGESEAEADKRPKRRGREKGPHKLRLRAASFADAPVDLAADAVADDEFWLRPEVEAPVSAAPTATQDETNAEIATDIAEATGVEPAVSIAERAEHPTATISEAASPEREEAAAPQDDTAADASEGVTAEAPQASPEGEATSEAIDDIEADNTVDDVKPRKIRMRDYKIQEVIKRRQIVLVQVVKEERGTKGAALTTFLSLAGRYCVLMPNTPRGGGISRKITSASDRKRLKALASEFEVPQGMGLIVRTAGANRTKVEIRRDYEYLLRQWAAIRDLTLRSIAPALIYEEGSLIKRAIRDLYNKDIDSVQVEGEDAYREAKDYMKMLMPSHAKNVQPYRETTPLFIKHQIESQVSRMLEPRVQLKSGGYLIINVTEALVAVDVNSGKSTKEGSIEDTALKTNLEAAEEVARQMKLRDLAGLLVIDFIDMEEPRNNRAVEKRLKEKLKNDRARIQIGRISSFGLLEMSRQRLRPGLLEATTKPCAVCGGAGVVRSDETMALVILRAIEEESVRGRSAAVRVLAPTSAANYILNFKRARIGEIEARYDIQVVIEGDPSLSSAEYKLERVKPVNRDQDAPRRAVQVDAGYLDPSEEQEEATAELDAPPSDEEDGQRESGRRTRRRRRKRDEEVADAVELDAAEETEDASDEQEGDDAPSGVEADSDEEDGAKKRRRGRRGGRRRRRRDEGEDEADPMPVYELAAEDDAESAPLGAAEPPASAETQEDAAASVAEPHSESASAEAEDTAPVNGVKEVTTASDAYATVEIDSEPADEALAEDAAEMASAAQAAVAQSEPSGPPRTGWWALRRNL